MRKNICGDHRHYTASDLTFCVFITRSLSYYTKPNQDLCVLNNAGAHCAANITRLLRRVTIGKVVEIRTEELGPL